jgi:hypothetical protein
MSISLVVREASIDDPAGPQYPCAMACRTAVARQRF